MTLFKPRVDKVIFALTTGRLCVIIPKKKLRRAQRKQTPSNSVVSSNDDGDASYRKHSKTPPSESYSCEEEHTVRGGEGVHLGGG